MRQVVLDTETTGLEPSDGHRVIEIGCVELIGRRLTGNNFHQYLNPDRAIDNAAVEVHGITREFLADKPRFQDVARDFLDYVRGAELIIHNAAFDVGFLNHELKLMSADSAPVEELCAITDTLALAKRLHPGQRNSLDALCKRYGIDNTHRELHGALLDAEILADVYLAITGGQTSLMLDSEGDERVADGATSVVRRVPRDRPALCVVAASEDETDRHRAQLENIERMSGGRCVWLASSR